VPPLIVTGLKDRDQLSQAMRIGGFGTLVKPINKPKMHTGGLTGRVARVDRRRHDRAQSRIYQSCTRDFVGMSLQISTIMLLESPHHQRCVVLWSYYLKTFLLSEFCG
jgi:DNA-binding NtrC family response regulator